MQKFLTSFSLSLICIFFSLNNISNANEVNVYTSRHYDSDDALYEKFKNNTGIKVNIISGKGDALMERLKSEANNSPADIFLTTDAGNLWKIQKEGLFLSINSENIKSIVPSNFRGPGDEWIAIAKRARVIFYNPNNVSSQEIENLSYEDLSASKWKGRIVIRSSGNIYNQSLVASLISNHGIEATEEWAKGLVSNLARKPQGNDRAQIIAVANGEADIAVANSYYYGAMLSGSKGEEQETAAKKVRMHFPNQDNRGVHVNISGAGILKSAPNKGNALTFLEFLLSEQAQEHIVNNTFEYPVLDTVSPSSYISQFGTDFVEDQTSAGDFGKYNPDAIRLMDRVGWQ